ncbi:hypothetical protein [Parafrankia elaeagni]|uniref:hypothetical protein n=1 Tax=Parafrankia elaeagni TaxID=222534 RepID=UPI000373C749|nr:hypothetical protein [Parafrankia elaeagni]
MSTGYSAVSTEVPHVSGDRGPQTDDPLGDNAPDERTRRRSTSITTDFRPGSFGLRDTWFPVAHTSLVGRRGLRRAIHGLPVHLWRSEGSLVASEDSPADRERGRRRASSFTGGSGFYPSVERYGYVWVWYGDPANASPDLIPAIPFLPEDRGLRRHQLANVVFDCSYELVCENLLDLTHADYLHSSLTGDALSDDDVVEVTSTSETVTMTRTATGRRTPKAQRQLAKSEFQDFRAVTLVYVRSGVCLLHGDFRPGMSVRMVHPANPESTNRCRTTVSFNPQRGPAWARAMMPLSAHLVGRQDNWALKPQNSLYLRPDGEKDLNSRFDTAGLRYRRLFLALVERQIRGDTSYLADGDPGRDVTAELGLDRP